MGLASEMVLATRNRWPSGEGSYACGLDRENRICGGDGSSVEPAAAIATAIKRLSGAR